MVNETNEYVLARQAGDIFRKLLDVHAPQSLTVLDALDADQLLVVRGEDDPVTRVFDGMDLEYKVVRPQSLGDLSLDASQVVVVASPGEGLSRAVREHLCDFVSQGGSLITTNQALRSVIAGGIFKNAALPALLGSANQRGIYGSVDHGKGTVYHFQEGLYVQCSNSQKQCTGKDLVERLGLQDAFSREVLDGFTLPGVEGHYAVFEALGKILVEHCLAEKYDLMITPSGGRVSYFGKSVSRPFYVAIPKDGLTVGRGDGVGIQLADSMASRHHGTISVVGHLVVYEDKLSSNGTIYNGRLVSDKVALSTGDVLQIGKTKLEVNLV